MENNVIFGKSAYFVLRDKKTGEPVELLWFRDQVDIAEVQKNIDKICDYYDNKETSRAYTRLDFVLLMLSANYVFTRVNWKEKHSLYV